MSEFARGMMAVIVVLGLACCGGEQASRGAGQASPAAVPIGGKTSPTGSASGRVQEGQMKIESRAFEDGAAIPARFTCAGEDVSPTLAVDGVPDRARTLALIVDDPDAPRGAFVHWLIWNIPAGRREIPEAVPPDGAASTLGSGTTQGLNGMRKVGYSGPCPPPGRGEHTYRFQLYALDSALDVASGASRERLEGAMKGHVLEQAILKGRFGR